MFNSSLPQIQIGNYKVPCKGVLFDKDGTLLDFMALWGGWAETLIRQLEVHLELLGKSPDSDLGIQLGLWRDEQGCAVGYDKTGPLAMANEEEFTALLAWQLYAAGVPWDEALLQIREYNSTAIKRVRQNKNTRLMPGLLEFLSSCREQGIQLAVVTSDSTSAACEHLEWMAIDGYFGSVVGRDKASLGKPFPEMALIACRELGLRPEDCLVIGDSNADMQMGKQAGVRLTVGLAQDQEGTAHLIDADVIVVSYNELKVIPAVSEQ